jgi:hypothetical protein
MSDPTDGVRTRSELVTFIATLAREAARSSSNWENRDLPSFLEALAAWTEDMDGYFINHGLPVPEQPTWQTFAQMLAAAKIYG